MSARIGAADRYISMMPFGTTTTPEQLAQIINEDADVIRSALQRAQQMNIITHKRRRGWLRLPEPSDCYADDDQRTKIWRAIRIFDQRFSDFTVDEIAARVDHKTSSVRSYLNYLTRAGYLSKPAPNQFRLERNTGPRAPVLRRCAAYDPNIGGEYEFSQ